MTRKALALIALTLALFPGSARAQAAYVAADAGIDLSRVSHQDSTIASTPSGTNVFSWDLRVGSSIGSTWGAELGYVQSLNDRSNEPIAIPLNAIPNIALPANFSITARHHRSSFDAAAWARQRAGGVDLVFLGGLSFLRDRTDISTNFGGPIAALAPVIPVRILSGSVTYSTHPLVGMEARIAMGTHARLVPGIRLQGIENGWLVRPYAGIGWMF